MSRIPPVLALIGSVLAAGSVAFAVTTRSWDASSAATFGRGTLDGTSIDEAGSIRLAPELTTLWGPDAGIVWAVQPARGNGAFVALSGPGRVLRVEASRPAETWYQADGEGLVTAMVTDGTGGAFFGLSPAGTVLHARAADDVVVVADSGAKFVWSLAERDGALWIGTGTPGRLLRVDAGGAMVTRFESGEDPVRCIAIAPDGTVVIGTGGRGRVIRIDAEGRAFALYDADEAEVVAIAVALDGTAYALTAETARQVARSQPSATGDDAGVATVRVVARPPPDAPAEEEREVPAPPAENDQGRAAQPLRTTAGGALYRVDSDGAARKIWSLTDAMPLAMGMPSDHALLVASGDDGRIHAVDREGRASSVLRIASNQASALAVTPDGRVLVGGTTDARVELLVVGRSREAGRYLGPPIDAGAPAEWGEIRWDAALPEGTRVEAAVRMGNSAEPDETWTSWTALRNTATTGGEVGGTVRARWLQVRLDLHGARGRSPLVRRIEVFHLPQNRAPEVQRLTIEPPGVILAPGPAASSNRPGAYVALDPIARAALGDLDAPSRAARSPRKGYEAGARTFTWAVADPDGDTVRQRLDARAEGTEEWIPLAREIDGEFFSWDARAMPDGSYRVRLTIDDAPDNPDGRHLVSERISDAFDIDNRRPSVEIVRIRAVADGFEAELLARDPGGRVASLEAPGADGEWQPLEPDDGVADAETERYRLRIATIGGKPTPVPVRVVDAAGNVGGEVIRP